MSPLPRWGPRGWGHNLVGPAPSDGGQAGAELVSRGRGLGSKLVMTCRHARTPQLPAACRLTSGAQSCAVGTRSTISRVSSGAPSPLAGHQQLWGCRLLSPAAASGQRIIGCIKSQGTVPSAWPHCQAGGAQAQSLCRDSQATSAGGAGGSPLVSSLPTPAGLCSLPQAHETPPNLASRFPVGGADLLASSPSWRQQGPQPCPGLGGGLGGLLPLPQCPGSSPLATPAPASTAQCPSASPRGGGPTTSCGPDPYCCSSPTWTFGALRAESSLTGDVLGGPWTLKLGFPLPGSPPLRASPEHPLRTEQGGSG